MMATYSGYRKQRRTGFTGIHTDKPYWKDAVSRPAGKENAHGPALLHPYTSTEVFCKYIA